MGLFVVNGDGLANVLENVIPIRGSALMSETEKREVMLFETLQQVTAHASHVIQNLAMLLENDKRLATAEWETKFSEWNQVWMHAQNVMCPGLLDPR